MPPRMLSNIFLGILKGTVNTYHGEMLLSAGDSTGGLVFEGAGSPCFQGLPGPDQDV